MRPESRTIYDLLVPIRPPPDDDPRFLARAAGLRRTPSTGDVVEKHPDRPDAEEPDEGPLPQDLERFSGVTKRCPECRKDVFDDSAVCYHCGHAFERTASGSGRTPLWIAATVVALFVAFFLAHAIGLI